MAVNSSNVFPHSSGMKRTYEPLADDITDYNFAFNAPKRRRVDHARQAFSAPNGAFLHRKRRRDVSHLAWPSTKRPRQDISSQPTTFQVDPEPQRNCTALVPYQAPIHAPETASPGSKQTFALPQQATRLPQHEVVDRSTAPLDTQLVLWREPALLFGVRKTLQ